MPKVAKYKGGGKKRQSGSERDGNEENVNTTPKKTPQKRIR